MTQVRLRDLGDGEAHVLGDVALHRIKDVIPTLKHWGLENDGTYVDTDTLCGTFKFNENGAYFEVEFE